MVSTPFSSSPFHSPSPSPHELHQKKTMSITQTYFLAHKARAKLSSEAARPDHNLRLLVGHANLLDSLMLDLADAEREQESWFNQSVRGATTPKPQERHVQWADSIVAEEDDWEADSSDSDDDSDMDDDEDIEMFDAAPLSRIPSHLVPPPSPKLHTMEADEVFDDEDEEGDEEFTHLGLTRSPSHSASPPELEHDSESSDDESMPPSPPTTSIPTFSEKQSASTITTKYYDSTQDDEEDKSDFYEEGFYLPPRNPNRLISAISVY